MRSTEKATRIRLPSFNTPPIFVGFLCDRVGPRICYTMLLVVGSTQYHTSVMFASNCVGTANATTGT